MYIFIGQIIGHDNKKLNEVANEVFKTMVEANILIKVAQNLNIQSVSLYNGGPQYSIAGHADISYALNPDIKQEHVNIKISTDGSVYREF